MNKILLITGGSRSGKSRFALNYASHYEKKGFIATAIAFDKEMEERIKAHQNERGDNYITVEEPYNIAKFITSISSQVDVIVIDCLTVWLGNLLHRYGKEAVKFTEIDAFEKILPVARCDIIIVTNEIGMGIIPYNKLARKFSDIAGSLNQRVAQVSDTVVFMVSGIPMILKEQKSD
jgi:adenosylcobinamide kinase/adenosylcobinamide-phosphate guanylyltransferase